MSNDKSKMYQNNNVKKFDNVQRVYSTMYKERNKIEKKNNKLISDYSLEKKIRDIFNSPSYVYKVDVIIEMDDTVFEKRIIGMNKKNLITMENEYIPIDKIQDIYLK